MNIQQNFCNYQISKDLKELGMDYLCLAKYFNQPLGIRIFLSIGENEINEAENAGDDVIFECSAPLLQQATQFLREKYNIHIVVLFDYHSKVDENNWKYEIINCNFKHEERKYSNKQFFIETFFEFETYNEALIKAVEESIKLIKSK